MIYPRCHFYSFYTKIDLSENFATEPYFATGDDLFQKSIKDIYPLIQKNSNIIVDFKSSKSREQKYLFSNSAGEVYKTNLKNQTFYFGNITRKETWAKIVANL